MTTPKRVVGLGEVLWDLYPDGKHLGGAPANVAVHAHRLGIQSVVVSAVGQDRLGEEIVKTLEEEGMDCSYIQRCEDSPTGTVGVKLNEKGVPHFSCSKRAAFDCIQWNEGLEELSGTSDAVVVGTLAQRNDASRRTVQNFLQSASCAIKVFDVNFRGWSEKTGQIVKETLRHTDILKLNEAELKRMRHAFGQEARSAIFFLDWLVETHGLKLAALSLGERGCLLTDGKQKVLSLGIRVDVVDTTGSGDGFVAGLIAKYLEGASLEETAEFANCLGAFVATKRGAAPHYAQRDVERFRKKHQERRQVKLP